MAARRRTRPGRRGERGTPIAPAPAPAAPSVTAVWPGPADRTTLYEMSFENETIRLVHHWYVADAPARHAARDEEDE